MSSKGKLFQLMALKDKIERNKFLQQAQNIFLEIKKSNELQAQLRKIADEEKKNKVSTTGLQFRAKKWYDHKIQEQISATENRMKFLKEETTEVKKKIAVKHNRMLKSLEKAKYEQNLKREHTENKNLMNIPQANKNKGFSP